MTKTLVLTFLTLVAASAFASETMKGAKKDLEAFKQEMATELSSIEKKLDVLKGKAQTKTDATYKETVKDLTAKREELRSELKDLHTESKSKFATAVNTLNDKIQKALRD